MLLSTPGLSSTVIWKREKIQLKYFISDIKSLMYHKAVLSDLCLPGFDSIVSY